MNPTTAVQYLKLSSTAMEGDAVDLEYRLGFFVEEGEPGSYRLVTPFELSSDEFEELGRSVEAVARTGAPFRYRVMERNYRTMLNAFEFATKSIALGRQHSTKHPRDQTFSASAAVVNWLTAVRLFLDHAETDLKRRFGASSTEYNRFHVATKLAYDEGSNCGYRFTYRFRNYVQHCGLPIASVNSSAAAEGSGANARDVSLLLDRDELITGFTGWGPVKTDVLALDPQFSLLPLAEGAMRGLRSVYHELLRIDLEIAVSQVGPLRIAMEKLEGFDGFNGHPVAMAISRDGDSMDFQEHGLPFEATRMLSEVADGFRSFDSLYSVPEFESEVQPTDRPLNTRFPATHRGIQVIATWLAEGGTTPGYFEAINRYLNEDGDYSSVLGGVIDVSVILVHMMALAVGSTPEGVVAGMTAE